MSYANYDDALAQLVGLGLIVDKPLAFDGRVQRWKVSGDDQERRGWSKLGEWTAPDGHTYIVGAFGVWHGNDDGKLKIELPKLDGTSNAPSKEDLAAIRARQEVINKQIAKEREAEAKQAGRWAANVWAKAEPATEHEYLARKQIGAHGTRLLVSLDGMNLAGIDDSNQYRLSNAKGSLVVPMHDVKGVVCGLQFIYDKAHPRRIKTGRDKEFWPSDMGMGGTFGLIGHIKRDGILLVCEGFATGASLHEATGQPVAYAFSANNLVKTGKALRKTYPMLRILFCADDDYLTDGNPGCAAAADATAVIDKAAWLKPNFLLEDGTDPRNGKKLTDFNDLAVLTGLPITLAHQVNAKLDELKWREAVSVRGDSATRGAGKRDALKSMLTIDEAIERFSLVFGGKGTMFDHQEHALVPKADVLDILPEHGWRDMRSVKRVARLDEVGFDPAEKDARITCNLWGGWPTVPKQGRCDALLELLEYLCSNEENHVEVYRWVLCWLAYPIQNPGAKMKTALVFHGPQGTGKNLFFEAYAAIFGEYGRIVDQQAIEDKFNDWASRKLFLIADEVVAQQELFHIKNKLKSFVTGDWIRINPKNVMAHDERNHVNLVFLSNESRPLVLEKDDRRYTVIHTPEKLSPDFYKFIANELDAGGVAALHHYLLSLDLGDFNEHSKPPMTRAKEKLIESGLDSVTRFVQEWSRGEIEWLPFCPCLGSHLYIAYRRWCEASGERSPRPLAQFIATLGHWNGWRAGEPFNTLENLNSSTRKVRKMVVPPDQLLATSGNYARKDGEETQSVWLTRCFFAFANAGGFDA